MERILVNAGDGYTVFIGPGLLEHTGELLLACLTAPAKETVMARAAVDTPELSSLHSPLTSLLSPLSSHLPPPSSHLSPLSSHLPPLSSHLPPLSSHLPPLSSQKVALITDSTVEPLYASTVEKSLLEAGFAPVVFSFAAGEQSKTMQTLSDALEFLAAEQLTREDCVLALGGGVVGDLAGFAAGCYLRGIHYVQVPTTLLAAVDSAVGGKTGIDLSAGKNLAGLFWQPSAVICSTDCLATLPEETFLDGVVEAIKTGVLSDEALYTLIEQGLIEENLEGIIASCVAYKAGVVEADEREGNTRKYLNLGHTIGHAIEACSGYTISHGRAVAAGLAMISRAAVAMGFCDELAARRIIELLSKLGLPTDTEFSTEELAQAALHDKKRSGNRLTLVLPTSIGSCVLHDIDMGELPKVIEKGRS